MAWQWWNNLFIEFQRPRDISKSLGRGSVIVEWRFLSSLCVCCFVKLCYVADERNEFFSILIAPLPYSEWISGVPEELFYY